MNKKINKILVANRGEIALRIMRSAKSSGISIVAVYSEADKSAPFVKFADESVCLGPAASSESYLRIDKIMEVCQNLKVDAVHPGYGFLSENAGFAQKLEEIDVTFIGPSAVAIQTMGDKISAKQAVAKFGVPLVPGMDKPIEDVSEARNIAAEIGYPVLIKASAGGGGKGMRIVDRDEDFETEMQRAMSEAQNAFGNGAVFVEKFISAPKHIEVQVIGDQHGNLVHLFERDCSIQRRHQKVVEEAPSSILNHEERMAIGAAALSVAKACDYYNAGTVEFIMDEDKKFYFLEMNTRLQVEHPVTEEITGVDLVKEQIRVAEGHPLSFSQSDLKVNGHSIEIRVYAEDPKNNFAPSIGNLKVYRRPQGEGIRLDDGYEEGQDIPIYYDPMIAKLVATGKDREEAIERLLKAILEYRVIGVETTLPFCRFVLEHEAFRTSNFTTKFVEQYFKPEVLESKPSEELINVALAAAALIDQDILEKNRPKVAVRQSNWKNRQRK